MVRGLEKQEPPTERSGALRDAPASIYVLGDFLPGARHLAFATRNLHHGPKCLTTASASP
jgi:hypothetical protein